MASLSVHNPKKNLFKEISKARYIYLLLLPAVCFYVVFHYFPIYGVTLAFKEYKANLGILGSPFVGLRNYEFVFRDPNFYRAFGNTILISLGRILFEFPVPILLALLVNELNEGRFKKTLQTVFTFPHFLSWVIVGSIFINLFGDQGAVNGLLSAAGLEKVNVFSNQAIFRPFLFFSNAWKEAGWSSIIYLSSIASIDVEQYESATIDGAGRLKKVLYITLPGIRATIAILLILAIGNVMNAGFEQVFILYNGTVQNVADIIDTYIYRVTFQGPTDFSFSTAIGLLKSVINFILLIIADRVARLIGEKGLFA